MEPIIKGGNKINTNDLKGDHPLFDKFKNTFDIEWVEPVSSKVCDDFSDTFRDYAKGAYEYYNYDFDTYKVKDVKMVLLRDLIFNKGEFLTYLDFIEAVTIRIKAEYGSVKDGFNHIFKNYKLSFDEQEELFKRYLFMSYKGFFSEHRTKLILASHSKCFNDRLFDVYKSDETGDTKEKVDFLVYVNRYQEDSKGFWKSIGNGSKTTKNVTEEKCSVVFHGFKCDNCTHLGYGLHCVPKDIINSIIEEVLALNTI